MIDHKIVVPSDYKVVDLLNTSDPNEFGEALRNFCFVGNCEQTGCYSTFEVIKQLKEVKSGKIFEEAQRELWEDVKPTVYYWKVQEKDCWIEYNQPNGKPDKMKLGEPLELVLGWAWEGDGCLYIRYNNKAVVNPDCKKDYNWEWVQE